MKWIGLASWPGIAQPEKNGTTLQFANYAGGDLK
jgi:hypothetical protein